MSQSNFQLHKSLGAKVRFFDSLNYELKTIEKLELLMFLKYSLCL